MATKPKPKKKYARKSTAARLDVYEHVTNVITEALEKGVTPWHKPWTNRPGVEPQAQHNAVTGRPYRGVNVFLLNVAAASFGYEDPRWLTFNQAAARAKAVWLKANDHKDNEEGETAYVAAVKDGYRGGVRKGETSTLVTLWRPFSKEIEDEKTGEKKKGDFLLLKYFKVFNVEQCDNLDLKSIVPEPDPDEEPEPEFDSIAAAETLICSMPKAPRFLKEGGNRAYYSPMSDHIGMPEATSFESPEAYYATKFHEMVHSTGHESRLGRIKDWASFGSEPYAQEELVAEMGSAMLCGMVGIDAQLDQSAAYIANWSKAIKSATANDKRWLVVAASRAQRAADHILAVPDYKDQPKNGEAA